MTAPMTAAVTGALAVVGLGPGGPHALTPEAVRFFDSQANPFLDEHLVLTSTTLFAKHPQRLMEALGADWGLVIVDEAHHLK